MNSNKLKNPYFWIGLISLIFTSIDIDFNTMTSWPILLDTLKSIVLNPVQCMTILCMFLSIWNDNGTPGFDNPLKNRK